jgi:hypothetical protein
VRRYLPWLLPAACAAALAPASSGDSDLFQRAGKVLLSASWAHTFANPSIQVGPLQLALFGSLGHWVGYLIAPVLAVLVVTAVRAVGVRSWWVLVVAGLLSIVTGLTSSGIDSGHPANALLPLLWIIAATQARQGRTLAAAAVVGVSAGFETWGILGIAVLALAPRLRSATPAAALAAGIAASMYLPFILEHQFAMGAFQWRVSNSSLMSNFIAAGTTIGWPLRIAQGACAVIAGVALARSTRRSSHVAWLVPAVVVLVRLLLDPLDSGYYMVGIEAPAIIGLALISSWRAQPPRFGRDLAAQRTAFRNGRRVLSGHSLRGSGRSPA